MEMQYLLLFAGLGKKITTQAAKHNKKARGGRSVYEMMLVWQTYVFKVLD